MGQGYFSIVRDKGLYVLRHAYRLEPGEKRFAAQNPFSTLKIHGRAETLDQIFKMGDKLTEKLVPRSLLPQLTRWAPWRQRAATENQKRLLEKLSLIDEEDEKGGGLTAGRAAALL